MPTVQFQDGPYCPGTPAAPRVTGCEGSSRSLWEVVDQPAGTEVTFSDPNSPDSTVDVSAEGAYRVRLCCFFEEGEVAPPQVVPFGIGCPKGVLAGQPANISLSGCTGTVEWSAGGAATGVAGTVDGATVTTDALAPGTGTVTAVCENVDIDGNITSMTETCEFVISPPDLELQCTTGPPIEQRFVACGQSCECIEATVVFRCEVDNCTSAQVGLVFIDCPPCEEAEPCEPLEFQRLVGARAAIDNSCDYLLDCGDCEEAICCEPDAPVFYWCNACTLEGWTMSAPAIDGTDIYNTCSCNPGQKWCFEGSATITFQGPPAFLTSLVIWGHNISDGEVFTSPIGNQTNPTPVRAVDDGSCLEPVTRPVIIDFSDVRESVGLVTVTITSNTPGPVCIDQIFLGKKFFLPDDQLPESFENPHNGLDYELETKNSECGPLSRSLKHVPVEMRLELDCLSPRWLKEEWRPFLRYAMRHGVLFRWSRNNCPSDIFNGWIEGPVRGSQYNGLNDEAVTLEARGYITQPQSKVVA